MNANRLAPRRTARGIVGARLPLAVVLIAALLVPACGTAQQEQHRTLTVLAAASLTESFDELGERFRDKHPDVEFRFDYQGSSTLAEQINQGRKADLFASANPSNMDKVVDDVGVNKGPTTFATNRLVLAVPAGNPAHIQSMAEARDKTVVTCEPEVPCGAAAEKAEQAAGVDLNPASEENDVKSVLRKVTEGEADAGLVYVTDVRSSGGAAQAVDIPEVTSPYPAAVLRDAPESELADEFFAFIQGPVGQEVLTKHGFGKP